MKDSTPDSPIINRIAASPLLTFDPADYADPAPRRSLDLADLLFQGMILREKDLREFVKTHDWAAYRNTIVSVFCSDQALIPAWALMILGTALRPHTQKVYFCSPPETENRLFGEILQNIDYRQFIDKKVVVKGCGDTPIPDSVYGEIALKLQPLVASLMFGEPCSTVPVFKKRKKK